MLGTLRRCGKIIDSGIGLDLLPAPTNGNVSGMNAKKAVCLVSCQVVMASVSAFAREGPPPKLNPKVYVSLSGDYSLTVNPTDMYGRGPADYRSTKDDKILWESRLPYTFWGVSVADSGQVAGYAFTNGPRGYSENDRADGPGECIVALLSAEGKTVNEEIHTRQWSRFMDSPPDPLLRGMLLDESNKRFVVRVADPDRNRRIELWWVFDLHTGKRLGTLEPVRSMPQGDEALLILHARAVPGTPLVLTHWWKYASGQCGGIFTLIDLNDPKGKPVWSLTLADDYTVPGNDDAQNIIQRELYRRANERRAEK
jgi:hypothetical protein